MHIKIDKKWYASLFASADEKNEVFLRMRWKNNIFTMVKKNSFFITLANTLLSRVEELGVRKNKVFSAFYRK